MCIKTHSRASAPLVYASTGARGQEGRPRARTNVLAAQKIPPVTSALLVPRDGAVKKRMPSRSPKASPKASPGTSPNR